VILVFLHFSRWYPAAQRAFGVSEKSFSPRCGRLEVTACCGLAFCLYSEYPLSQSFRSFHRFPRVALQFAPYKRLRDGFQRRRGRIG